MENGTMRRAGYCAAFLCLFALCAAGAQELSVSFIEGDVRTQNGSSWVSLSLGDHVSPQSTIQLSEGAYVELQRADVKVVLNQKGVYALRDLVSSSRTLGSAGVGKALMTTLSYLLKGPVHNQSDVAGARGADKSQTDDTEWATSNAQVYMDTGKDLLQSAEYDMAIKQFLLAVSEAADDELPQARYYLSYAYSLNGDTRNALKYAADLKPDKADDWAPDFVILKAKLLVDTSAFAQEVAWLTQPDNDLSGDMRRGSIYTFLLGVGYRGVGDTTNAKAALSKVVASSAGSDLGTCAAQLLQNP